MDKILYIINQDSFYLFLIITLIFLAIIPLWFVLSYSNNPIDIFKFRFPYLIQHNKNKTLLSDLLSKYDNDNDDLNDCDYEIDLNKTSHLVEKLSIQSQFIGTADEEKAWQKADLNLKKYLQNKLDQNNETAQDLVKNLKNILDTTPVKQNVHGSS